VSATRDSIVFRGRRVLVDGALRVASVHAVDGRITRIGAFEDVADAAHVVEAGERLLTPGLVDAHVHVNEPGRTDWEGFATATAAAAAGGVTTLVDMPLNAIPPTTTRAGAEAKRDALSGRARVDVALWGGLIPGNVGALAELAAFGVAGIKCFLCDSGVDEFPPVGATELDQALPRLRDLGLPLLAHAESPAALARAVAAHGRGDPRAYRTWLALRSEEAEVEAVELLIHRCRVHRAKVHVVHVSSAGAIERIAAARREGLPLTAETCPHYLTFTADEIRAGATEFKCAPPIRERLHQDALWTALQGGVLDLVATDHSPCPPELKRRETGDFVAAWGGIAGLQLLLPLTWTGAQARGHDVAAMLGWTAERPAALAGLTGRKGRLAPGHDADLIVWDEREEFTVAPEMLFHRHKVTPYIGRTLRGVVHETWVRGRPVYSRADGPSSQPIGEFVAVHRQAV
jgi:allantoinase